jgi:D-alanyl-D-alanine carboxypeptidase (penicillin-binding protein 5/6)
MGGRGLGWRRASLRWAVAGVAAWAAVGGAPALAATPLAPPILAAQSAVLYDPQTGQVLYALHPEERLYPASITKLLTAIVVVRHLHNLDRMVTITPQAVAVGGSSAPLEAGERISVRNLLYGLLLVSGNVARFSVLLNAQARALGAAHTHFTNPDGLPDPHHYTTAMDMARIGAYVLQFPVLMTILHTQVLPHYPMPGGGTAPMVNQDQLLWTYPGILGGKIGYTTQAGNTMVAIARRHGRTLVAVVLHDLPWQYYQDVTNLLNWGFFAWRREVVVRPGQVLAWRGVRGLSRTRVPLVAAHAAVWDVPVGASVAPVRVRVKAPRRLPPHRPRGRQVGWAWVEQAAADGPRVPVVLGKATPSLPHPAQPPWALGPAAALVALAVGWVMRRRRLRDARRRYRLRKASVYLWGATRRG